MHQMGFSLSSFPCGEHSLLRPLHLSNFRSPSAAITCKIGGQAALLLSQNRSPEHRKTMISHNIPHDRRSVLRKDRDDAAYRSKSSCRCEKRQRRSKTNSKKGVLFAPRKQTIAPPPPHANLFDILDEDLVISNTPIGFKCSKQLRPVASVREGRGRTTILDQIDGLVKEGDDTFMTSLSYPRGVHIIPRHSRGSSAIDLVLAEESFDYWRNEIENPEPVVPMPDKQ